MKAIAEKGWGYWDVTIYPYKGCFRRLSEDAAVVIEGPGVHAGERRVRFADGSVGIISARALRTKVAA